jgi:hypothetical protein
MTLRMLDSVEVGNLPPGADAYLGYVDGHFATFPALKRRFPGADLLALAVFSSEDADGCDCEPGDLTVSQVPAWVGRQLARGAWRPVVYASASSMGAVLGALNNAGILRSSVRLLSAHYGVGKHICGPLTCRQPGCPACDGTQWTDMAPGAGGTLIDESVLLDNFFGPAPAPAAPPVPKPSAAEEPDMILVQVNRDEVPKGTDWPGVFILDATGLHHVTSSPDLAAYQSAGVKGPVTISWTEYLERAGSVSS